MEDTFDALSIDEFCQRHRFSRGTWYNLVKRGQAPKFITIGARRFITREAADQWRHEREAAAPTEYELGCEKRRAAKIKAAAQKNTVQQTAKQSRTQGARTPR